MGRKEESLTCMFLYMFLFISVVDVFVFITRLAEKLNF